MKNNPFTLTDNITNSDMTKRLFVVDDFYSSPYDIRNFALNEDYEADLRYYKGNRTTKQYLNDDIKRAFELIIGQPIKEWESHPMNGRFQYCLPEDNIVYHADRQTWAGVLFLTPEAPIQTGTSFFKSKITNCRDVTNSYCEKSFEGGFYDSTNFELVDTVGNVFNRLVIFHARCIHAASNYFGKSKDNSRLTQCFFFD